MCDNKDYDGYTLGEDILTKFQRHGHHSNISISATHHSLREAISYEVVVTMKLAYPNHRARTSRVNPQSI